MIKVGIDRGTLLLCTSLSLLALSLALPAWAADSEEDSCGYGCRKERHACRVEAREAKRDCAEACEEGDRECRRQCRKGRRGAAVQLG